jgi:hypothetical protein
MQDFHQENRNTNTRGGHIGGICVYSLRSLLIELDLLQFYFKFESIEKERSEYMSRYRPDSRLYICVRTRQRQRCSFVWLIYVYLIYRYGEVAAHHMFSFACTYPSHVSPRLFRQGLVSSASTSGLPAAVTKQRQTIKALKRRF